MKTRLVLVNLLLLAGIALVAWQARTRLHEAKVRRQTGLSTKTVPFSAQPTAPVPPPPAPAATQYVDVAQKDLFSKDRNPNVVIDAPPPPEKPKPMPPLPLVYGIMGLPSGLRALMGEKPGAPSHAVRAGDTISDFKILSIDAQNIVFEWDGKPVPRKLEDLMDRGTPANSAAAYSAPAPGGPTAVQAPPTPTQAQIQGQEPQPSQPASSALAKPGVEMGVPGRSERACDPKDTSPAGTMTEGYKKTVTYSPFGARCVWVPAQ